MKITALIRKHKLVNATQKKKKKKFLNIYLSLSLKKKNETSFLKLNN